MINVSNKAKEAILKKLEDRSFVGVAIYEDKTVDYIHHFVGKQNWVTDEGIGICTFPTSLSVYDGCTIDFDGSNLILSK
jgi:hypothetical protein